MFYDSRNVVLLSVIVIVCCKLATVTATVIGADNTTNPDEPHEVQKAVCTVTAGDVRASAEAVTTKTLQGVCGSAEMGLAFRNLELKLFKEIQDIKSILKDLQKVVKSNSENHQIKLFATTPEPTTTVPPEVETTTPSARKPQLKSLPRKSIPIKEKSFSYYWKLENFTEHANSSNGRVESPIFSIRSKPLRIKASFNHLRRDFLYLHLVYATFEKRDKSKNNIVLDTGGIFKHIDEKVLFKHKISILDQNNGSNDLESQEFSSLDSGFPVPMSALLSPTYSKNNSLLIQISLYL